MSSDLLEAIEHAYGIPSVTGVENVATGVLSNNWILQAGDTRYFLKQYRYPERARVDSIHCVKSYFSAAGIPVIMPLATVSGETCHTHTDSRHYALFPYIAAAATTRGSLSDESVVSMAEMLAKLHLAGRDAQVNTTLPTTKSWSKEEFIQRAEPLLERISNIQSPTAFDTEALQDLQQKYVFVHNNQITSESLGLHADHVLHGDFLDHNLFFDEQGRVSHVFDWEKAAYGPRVYELLRSLFLSIADGELTPEYAHQAGLFMHSYRALYPISSEEIQRGITMIHTKSMHATWIQNEHYVLNNHRADKFLKIEHDRNTYLSEHREAIERILL